MKNRSEGFTLIELLIVIGIIGFLAAAILVAVDPVKRIQDARDSQRSSEVQGMLDAILKKQVDDVAQYDGEAGTAQVSTATLVSGSALDTWGVTINGTLITTAATGNPVADAVSLDAAIDGSAQAGVVTATSSTNVVTITSDFAGVLFTIVDSTSDGGGGAALTVATPTPNAIGAGIDSDNTSGQVIVIDATGVDCDTPATSPACPDLAAGLSLPTTNGFGCVAEIGGLASGTPNYLAEIPVDPQYPGTPTAGNLALGDNNSGYYINRNSGGRITVGACYGELNDSIKTSH